MLVWFGTYVWIGVIVLMWDIETRNLSGFQPLEPKNIPYFAGKTHPHFLCTNEVIGFFVILGPWFGAFAAAKGPEDRCQQAQPTGLFAAIICVGFL